MVAGSSGQGAPSGGGPEGTPQYIQLKDFRHQQHTSNGVLAGGNGVGAGIAGSSNAPPALGQSPKPSGNSFDVRFEVSK